MTYIELFPSGNAANTINFEDPKIHGLREQDKFNNLLATGICRTPIPLNYGSGNRVAAPVVGAVVALRITGRFELGGRRVTLSPSLREGKRFNGIAIRIG